MVLEPEGKFFNTKATFNHMKHNINIILNNLSSYDLSPNLFLPIDDGLDGIRPMAVTPGYD